MFAEAKAPLGVIVGTWIELLAVAEEAYLHTAPEEDGWAETLREKLNAVKKAFWSDSLALAPEETAASVEQALLVLWNALGPEGNISDLTEKEHSPRLDRHLADLARLEKEFGDQRPSEIARIRTLLETSRVEALRHISVNHIDDYPHLHPWQTALLEKLGADGNTPMDEALGTLQERTLKIEAQGISGTSLTHVQNGIFMPSTEKTTKDPSLFGLSLRDYQTEVEVTAGMIQKAASKDKVAHRDIGLLIPNDPKYLKAIPQVFAQAGVPLAGLPGEQAYRDLAYEALDCFLLGFEGPAPVMAIAALLTSPLMPWTNKQGHQLADRLMRGDFSLKPLDTFSKKETRMLDLIRKRSDGAEDLQASLSAFMECMDDGHGEDEDTINHFECAKQCIAGIATEIAGSPSAKAGVVRKKLRAVEMRNTLDMELSQEGVAVFLEGEEPWRTVQRLFIIGFTQGHFPGSPGSSPVFFEEDLAALKASDGIPVKTNTDLMMERRALFQRQICSAGEQIIFTVPKRDALGKEALPSDTLTFIENILSTSEADPLVIDLEQSDNLEKVDALVLAKAAKPKPPTFTFDPVLSFEGSLLSIRKTSDGEPYPESPSSLETLLVSPLAWLLQRVYAEPVSWQPEDFNPLVKGNLTHAVFENLFKPKAPLPGSDEIPDLVDQYFGKAIQQHMPLLQTPAWHVERQSLRRVMIAAATQWRDILAAMGATIVGHETWLQGNLSGMPIHGGADVIIQLPDKRLYVVDYKTATSSGRRPRMEKGYDSQASLYREMIKTGGLKDTENDPDGEAERALKSAVDIGVLYYMLNDQTGLADTDGWTEGKVPAIVELATDVSENIFPMIEDRLRELAAGTIKLNSDMDEERFESQAKIKPYALDASPLIRLFMYPAPLETEEASP